MRLVDPADVADHRGPLVLGESQEPISRCQFPLDHPVLTLVGDFPEKRPLSRKLSVMVVSASG